MYLYSVYDRDAERRGPYFECVNDKVAQRVYSGMNLPGPRSSFYLAKVAVVDAISFAISVYDEPVVVEEVHFESNGAVSDR